MRKPLLFEEISAALTQLEGWRVEGDALVRTFKFSSFRDAVAFIVRLSFECEQMDHHPDLQNVYNRVTIRLNTHDAGGKITEKDIELARRIQPLASE